MEKTKGLPGICIVAMCGLAWPGIAFAYIDPGTGAMLVQGLLALVAAVVFYFRNPAVLWGDFKGFVRRVGGRMFGRQSRDGDGK